MIIFATQAYKYLMNEIVEKSHFEIGKIEYRQFPDGESYQRILSDVKSKDVVLIGGTIDDANTTELYDLANGITQLGAKSLRLVIPYFGYATMERAVQKGEIVKAKNRALMLSSIPNCAEANQIFMLDLHAEGIPYYFGHEVRCTHLYAKSIIINVCLSIFGPDFVLACTDAGRAKWVESLANDMHVKSAFVYKHRISGAETQLTGVNADVLGKNVIIYDDMIRTGGSLMQATEAYHKAGAKEIAAIVTHGLFTNNAMLKLEKQGLLKSLHCTNSHPNSLSIDSSQLHIKSICSLIKEAIET
jgi:ribose-phosphate pyrophosphokinase